MSRSSLRTSHQNTDSIDVADQLLPSDHDDVQKKDLIIPNQSEVFRSEFIQKKLPEFFGVKSLQQQKSIQKGRHPRSIAQESELWQYAKYSNERRQRIKKGHDFWHVIDETSQKRVQEVESTLSPDSPSAGAYFSPTQRKIQAKKRKTINEKERQVLSSYFPALVEAVENNELASLRPFGTINRGNEVPTSQSTADSKPTAAQPSVKGSLQTQLKNAMSKTSTDIHLKIDFQHRSLLNYNMTFLILSMNDPTASTSTDIAAVDPSHAQALYFDDLSQQFRIKAITDLSPYDKAKFKVVDVINPSNPRAILFGDDIWLQVLTLGGEELSEEEYLSHHHNHHSKISEDSFQFGSLLTAKLYQPIEVPQVKYDTDFLTSSMLHSSQELLENHQRILARMDPKKFDKQLAMDRLLEPPNAETTNNPSKGKLTKVVKTSSSSSSTTVNTHKPVEGNHKSPKPLLNRTDSTTNMNTNLTRDEHLMAKRLLRQQEYNERMKPCGQVSLLRMIDPKKLETLPDSLTLSNDKCARYLQKQVVHLGRWTIHTAVRMDDPEQVHKHLIRHPNAKAHYGDKRKAALLDGSGGREEEEEDATANAGNSNEKLQNLKEKIHSHVQSLTPIIFQQDQYCLSNIPAKEYVEWPPDSTHIVNHSQKIGSGLATEYEKEYNEFLNTNGNHLDMLNLNDGKRGEKGGDSQRGGGGGGGTRPLMNIRRVRTANSRASLRGGAAKKLAARKSQQVHSEEEDFGCLRRLLPRPAPYEYVIDRRSVWRICLFEQFSEATATQSSKEKETKKVMETANMVLKLSKMNREGARIHLQENQLEKLPPLASGERFVQSLREIRWKKQFQQSTNQLNNRRWNEVYAQDYFQARIQDVLKQEENGFQQNLPKLRSNQELFGPSKMKSLSYSRSFSVSKSFDSQDSNDEYDDLPLDNSYYHQLHGTKPKTLTTSKKQIVSPRDDHPSQDVFTLSSIDSKFYSVNSNDSLKTKKAVSFPIIAPNRMIQTNPLSHPSPSQISLKQRKLCFKKDGIMASNASVGVNSASTTTTSRRNYLHLSDQNNKRSSPKKRLAAEDKCINNDDGMDNEDDGNDEEDTRSVISLLSMSSIGAATAAREGTMSLATPSEADNNTVITHTTIASSHSGKTTNSQLFSEDVRRTFNTNHIAPYDRPLLLTNTDAIREYSQFTPGEQLLSLHKTMKHLTKAAKRNLTRKKSSIEELMKTGNTLSLHRTNSHHSISTVDETIMPISPTASIHRNRHLSSSILSKIAQLEAVDQEINEVVRTRNQSKKALEDATLRMASEI